MEIYLCSWFGRISIVNISIVSKVIQKRTQITKAVLSKNNKVGDITLSDLKIYLKAIAAKIGWYWHISRHIDEWNMTEILEINPCISNGSLQQRYQELTMGKG